MSGTDQFVLLQVESLQFAAPFGQGHHAFISDAVALTQVDVFQLTTLLPQLRAKKAENITEIKHNNERSILIDIYFMAKILLLLL